VVRHAVTSHRQISGNAVTSAFTAIHPVLNRNQRRYHVNNTHTNGASPRSPSVRFPHRLRDVSEQLPASQKPGNQTNSELNFKSRNQFWLHTRASALLHGASRLDSTTPAGPTKLKIIHVPKPKVDYASHKENSVNSHPSTFHHRP
jgi:hypothetical protein